MWMRVQFNGNTSLTISSSVLWLPPTAKKNKTLQTYTHTNNVYVSQPVTFHCAVPWQVSYVAALPTAEANSHNNNGIGVKSYTDSLAPFLYTM